MCLDYELSEKQANKIKALARKRGYIRVWKVCQENRTGWHQWTFWKNGLQKAKYLRDKDGGWYAYLSLKEARRFNNRYSYWGCSIKTCYAKPSHIKRLGRARSGVSDKPKTGIFTHLAFPNWDKGDMTIREFKEMCKQG